MIDQLHFKIACKRAGVDKTKGIPSNLLSSILRGQSPNINLHNNSTKGAVEGPEEIVQEFLSFYQDLYERKSSEPTPELLENIFVLPKKARQSLRCPPNALEVAAVLDRVDGQSAPGMDGIPYRLYQKTPMALQALLHLYNMVWTEGTVPRSWKQSIIKPIPKEGKDVTWVKNYRPIALTCADGKILTAIINTRLQPILQKGIPMTQTGFIQGRTTEHAIIRISTLLQHQPALRALLLDFKKAYDRVSHCWLQTVLEKGGFPTEMIQIILSLNSSDNYGHLLINNTFSNPFKLASGIKQGDSLSPTLFILCLHPLLNILEKKGILHQAHADDTISY